ncbi:hypothetical protein M2352_000212 [Azospirillum fermentarium]|uniref:sodium-dependent bicarbonate transport family permease n=1 Tax=Azospirillum fermentarium TaxID=1233114 RepID=UPI002225FDE9|nr:sodium-dependent bicarbonate transport family permease [Azospirillum fermentarium]MCW2244621.1 hypothetical protein [Azospirillum fermentarium]
MNALFSAPILFFALGGAIALAGARIPVPDGFGKTLAAYLLVAIGLKGGAALSGSDAGMAAPLLATAAALSFTMPLLGFALLRRLAGVDRVNAAAIAAHYGSVSLVTFVTATRMLESQGIGFGGYMAAALAVMEGPAIVSGLLLAGLAGTVRAGGNGSATLSLGGGGDGTVRTALREAALNGSVLLLAGSLLVGLVIGKPGMAGLHGLFVAPWDGVLCLFLLEMGYVTAARMREAARLGPRLIAFGLAMPLIGAVIGLGAAMALGLRTGDAALLVTLCASASYIAVPAALQHALPAADPGVSLPLALGITFPVNILAGIPLYIAMAAAAVG